MQLYLYQMIRRILPFVILSLSLFSCSKETEDELPANFEGYTYLPLEVGQERIYQIDSITYDEFTGTIDTSLYYQRELIEDQLTDLQGAINYQVAIFRRTNDSVNWRRVATELRYRGTYRYEQNLGGIVYLPLVFPPLEESRWNVNALNAQDEQIFRYQNLHQSYSTIASTYDSSITVLQRELISLIGEEIAKEVYATGLGLVYKENIDLQTDINTGDITSGTERFQYLIQP